MAGVETELWYKGKMLRSDTRRILMVDARGEVRR